MDNCYEIRDTIITAFEVSRLTKVPMLFISNPGQAKTSIIQEIADHEGYHLETLIGSAFDRSEVLGYMVNEGGESLEIKVPYWFKAIKDNSKDGKPSILFIDELSTAPSDVQGSLYRLIFDRELTNGAKLPEDCIILSAANYKGNLPQWNDITAPSLNRFCLINLFCRSPKTFLDECLMDEEERIQSWPVFEKNEATSEYKELLKTKVREYFDGIFKMYQADSDSSQGKLDIKNKDLNSLYNADIVKDGQVLNFISWRTVGYFKKCVSALALLGVDENNCSFLPKMVDGLIGAGTGLACWDSYDELKSYRRNIRVKCVDLIANLKSKGKFEKKIKKLFADTDTVSRKCQVLSKFVDSTEFDNDVFEQNIKWFKDEFDAAYGDDAAACINSIAPMNTMDEEEREVALAQIGADMDELDSLIQLANKKASSREIKKILNLASQKVAKYNEALDF